MLHSSVRKLALSGWLREHDREAYELPRTLQKYLFFYEAMRKIAGAKADFEGLQGCEDGPVFSVVWEDYSKNRETFDSAAVESFQKDEGDIDELTARRADFLVRVMTEEELAGLSREYAIWATAKPRILTGEEPARLREEDFGSEDAELTERLSKMYSPTLEAKAFGDARFVFSREDVSRLTDRHHKILEQIATSGQIEGNPVFVELDEDGTLIFD